MPELTFVTGNSEKFHIAEIAFQKHSIMLEQASLDIDEIQSEDSEKIIQDKLAKAYAILQKPVVVNDDSWIIPGLRGFPGPYLKSIAHWFTTDDFLRLTSVLEDRSITLVQRIAYQDDHQQKYFSREYTGTLLKESRGQYGNSLQRIVSMPGDNGLSVAEVYDRGATIADREVTEGWDEFIKWYEGQIK